MLLVSYPCFSKIMNTIPPGVYSYTQKGDELIDGQKESITWSIKIKNNQEAVVTISSWHAPFTCDGLYTITNETDYVALSWSEEFNKDTECDMPAPQIFLKKHTSGSLLIRSDLFIWGRKDWQKMNLIHN